RTCQHQPLRSVNAYCYGISQKTRVRAYRSVSETFLSSFRFLPECYFPIYYAKCLDKYSNDQNFQIRHETVFSRAVQKSPQNVTGQNHINHYIVYIFLLMSTYYINTFYNKTHHYQKKSRNQQCNKYFYNFLLSTISHPHFSIAVEAAQPADRVLPLILISV